MLESLTWSRETSLRSVARRTGSSSSDDAHGDGRRAVPGTMLPHGGWLPVGAAAVRERANAGYGFRYIFCFDEF